MGKIRRFLGILTAFATVFLCTNVFAGGFDCPDTKKYTSCKSGYYLSDCGTTTNELLDNSGKSVSPSSPGNSCETCPAGFTCSGQQTCPVAKCNKITINANGGNISPNVLYKKTGSTVWYNDSECTKITISQSAISASRTDWTFSGLYTTNATVGATELFDSTGTSTGAAWTVTSDTTIYAKWDACLTGTHVENNTCVNNTYTVIFNGNGANSGSMSNQSFTYGIAQNLTKNAFVRTGYTFLGWSTSASATAATYTNGASVSKLTTANNVSITLYAVWRANTYTVSFNSNYGTAQIKLQSFTYGVSQNLTANTFTRTGYTFKGWSPNKDATVIDFADKQSVSDLTSVNNGTYNLYAVWQANTYTISFNANGGSGGQSGNVTATYGKAMPTISTTAPTRDDGYNFIGWYDNPDYTYGFMYYTANGASARPWDKTANTTLYAGWESKPTYVVTVDYNNPVLCESYDGFECTDLDKEPAPALKEGNTGYKKLITQTVYTGKTMTKIPIAYQERLGYELGYYKAFDEGGVEVDVGVYLDPNTDTGATYMKWDDGDFNEIQNWTYDEEDIRNITYRPMWKKKEYACSPGKYWNVYLDGNDNVIEEEVDCPAGYFCDGTGTATYADGAYTCASKCPTDYPYSNQGNQYEEFCYLNCTEQANYYASGTVQYKDKHWGLTYCEYETYDVTFKCDANTELKTTTVQYNGALTAPDADECNKEGYLISRWTENTSYEMINPGSTIEHWSYSDEDIPNIVFTAEYEPNKATVYYDVGNGTLDASAEQVCTYGTTCVAPTPNPPFGHYFNHWKITEAPDGDYVDDIINAGDDLTQFAKYDDGYEFVLTAQYASKVYYIDFYCDDTKTQKATDPMGQPNDVAFGGNLCGVDSSTAEYRCGKDKYHVVKWKCDNYELNASSGHCVKYDSDVAVSCVAEWESDYITCEIGQYYNGETQECTKCKPGSYCDSKTEVLRGSVTDAGLQSCLDNAFTALVDTGYEDQVSSNEGSKDITDCYFIVPAGRQLISPNGEIGYMESGWYNTGGAKVHYTGNRVDKSEYAYECSADYGEFYRYSDIGSTSHAQCYGEITFNKNSGIGSLNGEDAEKNTATQKCYLNDAGHAECTLLSGASLTRTGFAFNGWGTDTTCNTKATSVKPNSSTPASLTYYACWSANTVGCSAGYYLPAKSTSAANCTLCEEGSYCPGGSAFTLNDTEPQGIFDCASVGTGSEQGNYNRSDAGASSADECYTMAETACYDPCEGASRCTTCPENFSRCAYETTATLTVIRYSSGDDVEIGERTCPIKTGTEDNVCDTSHYFSEETNDCSNSCESLGGQCQNHDGTTGSCWNSSSKATPSKGTNACYGFGCKATCDLFNDYLIYSDGTFYDTPINHCPKNANCTDNTESNDSIQSYRWYPQTICTPSRPCTFTYTCNAGYVASTTGDITYGSYRTLNGSPTTAVTLASCDPGVFVVELDPNGGVGGTSNIWQKYTVGWFSDEAATKSLNTIQIPTRENYRFLGYFLDGTEVIDMDGIVNPGASNLFTSNGGIITAQWERLQTECKAGKDADDAVCQPGYYCPGGWVDAGTEYDKNTGCMRLCPTDKINGNVSSAEYSDDITDCYTVRSDVELGDETGAGDQTCVYGTNAYDASCNIKITSCVAGRYREAENSQTCALVGIGAYSVEGSVEKMLCSALAGANEYTTTSVDNASAPTQCYNTCNNITIDNGQRVPKQSSVYYDNTNIPACEYTTQCNTGYTGLGEACYPKVFTITLDKDAEDATQPVNTIYLKYNDGWYSKSTVGANGQPDATDRIESVAIPTRPAYSFGGYLNYDGDIVIGPDGRLSTNYTMFVGNTTLTASWELKPTVTCEPGLYYEGAGEYCTACPAGAYCGGVTTYQDEKVVKGIEYCADLNGTYVAGKDASGNALNVVVTSERHSEIKTDCYAVNVEYVSGTNRATGSQTCAYDDATKSYSANCWDVKVNTCIAGHWLQDATDTDCIEVDYGYYSAAGSLSRVACPNLGAVENVTTQSTTSEKVTQCYLGDRWVETQNGAQRLSCYHIDNASVTDVAQGYSYQCAMPVIVACAAGYYDDGAYVNTDGVRDCAPVGKDYYSPEQTFFTNEPEQPLSANPGSSTLRTQCPVDGRTDTTTAGRASACYKEKVACDITNGKGENTCHYDDTKGAYALDCTTCIVTGCDENFSQVGNTCIGCPEDNVCFGGEKNTCSELTGGKYEYADEGTTDVAYCYRDCALGQNATQMSGRDYYGSGVADTCQITACQAGYYLNNGQCVTCPAGSVCTTDEPGNTPKTCSELTGGLYTMSAPGASSIDACYKACEEYAVTNGIAVPVEDTVFYPFECEFEGRSPTGNPCDIINNVCIETSCNYNFELIDGVCTPCARENAISYKQGGNCVVESCVSGFHPNGQACEPNVIECSAPNAVASAQKWDSNKNAFGECIITECADGYHLGANACQVDEQVCELENGIGVREWNHNTNTWGECIATSCNPGYTNDRGLTNENWKQCGRCNNMYSANGELAASSYVRGCEIASCMYQGELYTLENNECRLICDTYSDETGSRKWNASRKKCEHTCAPGYTTW